MYNRTRSLYRASWHMALPSLVFLTTSMLLAQQASPADAGGPISTFSSRSDAQAAKGAYSLPNGPLTVVPDDFSDLRLAPGFLLGVMVYYEPELTTHIRVDNEGNIDLPLIGSIHVAGKTLADATKEIEDKFRSAQILKDPQVTLNVEQYVSASVTVLGEVQVPGRIQLLAPHSLLDVIGMAGGETNLAGDIIQVESPGPNGTSFHEYHYARGQDGNEIRGVLAKPGDIITVKRAGIVYVLGAVNRPGGYVMQEDGTLNVAQAVSLAFGTTLQAKIGGMRVVRRDANGNTSDIPIAYKAIVDGKDTPLQLKAEDIVYVPVSKLKTAFTAGATIIAQAGAATIYAVH
jgi:polysaccharide export outer membrane protein